MEPSTGKWIYSESNGAAHSRNLSRAGISRFSGVDLLHIRAFLCSSLRCSSDSRCGLHHFDWTNRIALPQSFCGCSYKSALRTLSVSWNVLRETTSGYPSSIFRCAHVIESQCGVETKL